MDDRLGIYETRPPFWGARRFWFRVHHPFPDAQNNARLHHRLNPRDGERVLRVVPKHVVVYYPVVLALSAVLVAFVIVVAWWSPVGQFLLLIALAGLVYVLCRAYAEWRDVFVVTNWRVVRLSGVITARAATMPINRILDMTMTRPGLGRILGYGHFVFESAAQEQGLREIRFVPDILTIDREINDSVNQETRRREQMAAAAKQRRREQTDSEETEITAPITGL